MQKFIVKAAVGYFVGFGPAGEELFSGLRSEARSMPLELARHRARTLRTAGCSIEHL